MPSAATQSPPADKGAKNDKRPMASVPFIRASALHREAAFFDQSTLLSANQVDFGVIEVPAYGYIRNIVILVEATGGAAGLATVAKAEDAPFTVLQNIQLNEPNGAQLQQFTDGYELYLANKWGGYNSGSFANDPRASPLFTEVTTAGNFAFMLRVPVELNQRDGLGSLPNQAANATFRLRLTLGSNTDVFATAPDTKPTVRVRLFAETWDQPEVSSGGLSNETVPPAMNTTQLWSRQVYNVVTGLNTIKLTRVGNYIRNLVFILRSGSAPSRRSNAQTLWGSQTTVFLDSRPIDIITDSLWRHQMYERSGGYGAYIAATTAVNANELPFGQDNGVRVYDFAHEFDGMYGRENRDLWLPTLGSTRLEIQTTFGTLTSGTLTVMTNDVAIAGNVFI